MARILYLCAFLAHRTVALELNWIPEGDGPLPLSKAYREQLARLCAVVEAPREGPLPPSIMARYEDIVRMCAKLRAADAGPGPLRRLAPWGLAAAGGGWLYHSYTSRGWLYDVVRAERRRRASPRLATPLSPARRKTYEF